MRSGSSFWILVFATTAFISIAIGVVYGKASSERTRWWLIVLSAVALSSPLTLMAWNIIFENTSWFVGPAFTYRRGIKSDDGLAPAFFICLLNALFIWGGVEIADKKHPPENTHPDQ